MSLGTTISLFMLRVYVGATFLLAGIGKIWPGFDFGKSKEGWLGAPVLKGILEGAVGTKEEPKALRGGLGFFENLVRDVFVGQASILTYLIVFGEILVGIGLLIGLLTRVSASFAIGMTAMFFLLTWEAGFFPWTMLHNWAFAICVLSVMILISGAGLAGGVDGKLRGRP